jgi:hypothetical protein
VVITRGRPTLRTSALFLNTERVVEPSDSVKKCTMTSPATMCTGKFGTRLFIPSTMPMMTK